MGLSNENYAPEGNRCAHLIAPRSLTARLKLERADRRRLLQELADEKAAREKAEDDLAAFQRVFQALNASNRGN